MKTILLFIGIVVICIFTLPLCAQITYDWGIISANQDSIYAYVHAVNTSGHETLGIVMNNWLWVQLFVDNEWALDYPDSTGITVNSGLVSWDDYTEYISFNPEEPIPIGNHIADVRLFQSAYNYVPIMVMILGVTSCQQAYMS